MTTVTVLSAIPCGLVVKLVAIPKIETAVESTQAIHHAVIGPRSRACDCSAWASSIR